ncbi:MAG: hypothetical protein IJ733_12395 [Lachnospiraceae bacterium]|nr:hypothetical protein [Lachnospiraceae bacterium]
MKEAESGNPVEDIFEKFEEYLGLISEDGITLCSLDEKFTAVLTSRMETDGSEIEHMLTYGTLSEGTKDTISLAFRLAMLEHIFPDGDGLAVFDDPFTDMDPGRVRQACRLIERFAEKNQVIFLTCDEKYRELLHGGNLICGQP